jgi:hypothetical protein
MALVILEIGACFLPMQAWTSSYFGLPAIAVMTGMHHHTQLFPTVEMRTEGVS